MSTDMTKNWFWEVSHLWPGFATGFEIDEELFRGRSEYQDVLVFKSKNNGTILVLDGAIQIGSEDDFCYNETIVNLPLSCHAKPRKVLLIGAGSGGAAREVLKTSDVEKLTICEIDQVVIEVARKYFPETAKVYDDPRVELIIEDGSKYLKGYKEEFDVIISDSPDPIGPGKALFVEEYYTNVRKALKKDGLACFQGENIFFFLPLIRQMMSTARRIFPSVDYGHTIMPTFGTMGYLLCSAKSDTNFRKPLKTYDEEQERQMNFRYYTTDLHKACFYLPLYVRKEVHPESTITSRT